MGDLDAPACGVPARLIAGNSWAWASAVPVVEGVNLAVILRPRSGGEAITVEAGVEGRRRIARRAPAATAFAVPGPYAWVEVLTRPADGARWTAGEGRVEILPDPATSGGDMRSQAERILSAIDDRIAGRVTADCDAYTIEGRSITRTPLDILMRVRGTYARQVAAEQGRGGVQFQRITFG